jgi:hypothetical protein
MRLVFPTQVVLQNRLERHHQQRDLHVENVASILDRVSDQIQGRDGEFDLPKESLEDFLRFELDATTVTIGAIYYSLTLKVKQVRHVT